MLGASSVGRRPSQRQHMDALLLPALGVLVLGGWSVVGGLECAPPGSCSRLRNHHLACSGGLHQYARGGSHKVRSLRLCGWPGADFSPQDVLPLFPGLTHLELLHANVTNVSSAFLEVPRLQKLNMSYLLLEQLGPGTLERLTSLKELDLRHNRMSFLQQEVLHDLDILRKVYLDDNPWNCSLDMTWLLDSDVVADSSALQCSNDSFPGKPLTAIMAFTKELKEECPAPCVCWIGYVIRTSSDALLPLVSVDCRQRGLQALPSTLPANTTTLLAQGNQISDLTPLAVGAGHYLDVKDVYLDDNVVSSVAVLEDTPWLSSFRALSLRGNRLSTLPTYAIKNGLDANHNALSLHLGHNPWRCDCLFTPAFHDLLLKYAKLVRDVKDIRCNQVEGDENSLMMVTDLTRSAVCREPSQYLVQPLHLLNAVLAALIVLVLGKLAFDYWSFKKTGKLPWIVAKMP